MTLRLVSPGRGESRDLCIAIHCDMFSPAGIVIAAKFRDAAPDAIVANLTGPAFRNFYSQPQSLSAVKEWALKASGALSLDRVVVASFSEGCQTARSWLIAGESPDAIVACDGTHASQPPNMATQIEPWKAYANAARAGAKVFVASHTQIDPPNYLSTRAVLRLVTGFPLQDKTASSQVGKLAVHSFPGADAAAHIDQCRNVLAELVKEAFSLMAPPLAIPEPRPSQPAAVRLTYAEAVLAAAKATLDLSPLEVTANDGSWIRKVLGRFGLKPPNNYCAAGATEWLYDAARLTGLPCPVAGSPGAKALLAQFQANGLALPAKCPREKLGGGMLAFWHRGPPGSWQGHTGCVVALGKDVFFTIEANGPSPTPGNLAVAMHERRFDDPLLLGFARYS